VNDTQA